MEKYILILLTGKTKIYNTDPATLTVVLKLKVHHLPFLQLRWGPVPQGQLSQIMQKQFIQKYFWARLSKPVRQMHSYIEFS